MTPKSRRTAVAQKVCAFADHDWLVTHHDNGSGRDKMICDTCGTRSTLARIEATARMLRANRIRRDARELA